jgi:hypothetical protein
MKKIVSTALFLSAVCFSHLVQAQNDPSTTPGDTGTVSFTYRGDPVTYITVRADDGKIWLQQSLGATQRAASATDNNAYGHLFQWGRWDDGHQLRTSTTAAANTLSSNNPIGLNLGAGSPNFYTGAHPNDWWSAGSPNDTWSNALASTSNGVDPCAAIGPGWHMPSQPEWANVITLENITDVISGFSSNLKLTAAGSRDANAGILINVGVYGNYWSGTPSTIYAKHVAILDNSVNNSDDGLRSYGMSIRCMTECTGVFSPDSIEGADTVCGGTLNTYTIPAVANANGYAWSTPAGWTIVGSASGTTVTYMVGNADGIITVSAVNDCGNSLVTTLPVVVNPAPVPVIVASGNVLSTTATYADYLWFFNEVSIPSATNPTYTATNNGNYRVKVTDANGCSDTSAIFNLTITDIKQLPGADKIKVYPNPATSVLHIDAPMAVDAAVYSLDGRLVLQQKNAEKIDISKLSNGVYQLKLSDHEGRLLKVQPLSVVTH